MGAQSRTRRRQVVLFGRVGWGRARPLVKDHVAVHRGRQLLFPETGHAILNNPTAGLLAELRAEGMTVRREAMLRRPNTTIASAPRTRAILDTARLAWALSALGLSTSDRDGLGVRVGLIDSGVDVRHPALIGSVSVGSPRGGLDALGHGTHCAGIIVGRRIGTNPRFGIAPYAHVRSYRLFEANATADEGHARELVRKAVEDGCRIIVLAAGMPTGRYLPDDASLGRWLTRVGCLMFAAAGNESDRLARNVRPTIAPANAPDIYAIGAATASTSLWNSSNGFGADVATRVDAIAPGVDVLSAWPGGSVRHVSGSSVATAVAGAVAAALWSRRPDLRSREVVALMTRFAHKQVFGDRDGIGAGMLSLRGLGRTHGA